MCYIYGLLKGENAKQSASLAKLRSQQSKLQSTLDELVLSSFQVNVNGIIRPSVSQFIISLFITVIHVPIFDCMYVFIHSSLLSKFDGDYIFVMIHV